MNKDIIIISSQQENTKKMKTIIELCGYKGFFVEDLNEAFNITDKFVPLLIVIVDEEESKTEIFLKEIKRYMPLMPVIIMMSEKNHIRAEKLISFGAYSVIEFPWTEVEFAKKVEMLEIKNIKTEDKKESQKTKKYIFLILLIAVIFTLVMILPLSFTSKTESKQEIKKDFFLIPSNTVSGFITINNKLYIYDWVIQSFYVFDYKSKELLETKKFFTPYIITTIKDTRADFFLAITDSGEIKKFLKDNKFTEISSTLYTKPKDLCYDGMYVWIVNDDELIKAINNDALTPLESHPLEDDFKKVEHIICYKNNLYFYINRSLIKTDETRPFDKISKITLPYTISAIDLISEGKIGYIKQNNRAAQLFEITF